MPGPAVRSGSGLPKEAGEAVGGLPAFGGRRGGAAGALGEWGRGCRGLGPGVEAFAGLAWFGGGQAFGGLAGFGGAVGQ